MQPGGLDDTLNTILSLCDEQQITYVFALGRKAMGCAVGKLVPVSIVGVFDYNGVEVATYHYYYDLKTVCGNGA